MDPILAVGTGGTLAGLVALAIWVVRLVGAPVKDAADQIKAAHARADAAERRTSEARRDEDRMRAERNTALDENADLRRRLVMAEAQRAAALDEADRLRAPAGGLP